MIELNKEQARLTEKFFTYTDETLILSYVQGHMGRGWVDDLNNSSCAKILVGDFCFIAGNHHAEEAVSLVKNIPAGYKSAHMLLVPQNEGWGSIIEAGFPGNYDKFTRYAIKKGKDCFCEARLQAFVERLPDKFRLAQIDEALYHECLSHDFSRDFCSQFSSQEDYISRGLGYCVLYDGEIVCGASSYTMYDKGIEIEISTKKEHRRQGLATACAARLIMECLKRGIYPSWDAANKASVALAEKLGYHFDHEYDTYEIDCTKLNNEAL